MTATQEKKQKVQKNLQEYRYKRAFEYLYKKQGLNLQMRIGDVKNNPDLKDGDVDKFIKEVINLAESDVEL